MAFNIVYGPAYGSLFGAAQQGAQQDSANRRQEEMNRIAAQEWHDQRSMENSLGQKQLEYSLESQRKMRELSEADAAIESQPFTAEEKVKARKAIALRRAGIQPSEFFKPPMETPTFHQDESGTRWIRTSSGWEQVKSKTDEIKLQQEQHKKDQLIKQYLTLVKMTDAEGKPMYSDESAWAAAQKAVERAYGGSGGYQMPEMPGMGQGPGAAIDVGSPVDVGAPWSGTVVPGMPAIAGPLSGAQAPMPAPQMERAIPAEKRTAPVAVEVHPPIIEAIMRKFSAKQPLTQQEKALLMQYRAMTKQSGPAN